MARLLLFGAVQKLTDERTAQVLLKGDLDVFSRETVASALPDPESVDRVVIDCSAVTSIDSSVIATFMRYRREFAETGRDPLNIVVIASVPVRRLFEITGLVKAITVIRTPEQSNSKLTE